MSFGRSFLIVWTPEDANIYTPSAHPPRRQLYINSRFAVLSAAIVIIYYEDCWQSPKKGNTNCHKKWRNGTGSSSISLMSCFEKNSGNAWRLKSKGRKRNRTREVLQRNRKDDYLGASSIDYQTCQQRRSIDIIGRNCFTRQTKCSTRTSNIRIHHCLNEFKKGPKRDAHWDGKSSFIIQVGTRNNGSQPNRQWTANRFSILL